jgi:hypothetical protein
MACASLQEGGSIGGANSYNQAMNIQKDLNVIHIASGTRSGERQRR